MIISSSLSFCERTVRGRNNCNIYYIVVGYSIFERERSIRFVK